MSNTFRCQTCGVHALAKGYHFFGALYGLLVVVLTTAGIISFDFLFGAQFRFEYLLAPVAMVMILLVWLCSARYWRLVLRWIEVT
jgi:hypothetical protein